MLPVAPPHLTASIVDSGVIVGTGSLLLTLFGYLFREIRRKDEGVWAIVADRDKRILEVTTERNYWRALAMGEEPPALDVLLAPHPAPQLADDADELTIRHRRRRKP